ncbi:unnamed protein product [Darwinula stevensoni]|uniref:Lipase domain-containing protein n=1 Tax=Darwinula stevensoni TaxID=69355 RepID=A0A7R8XCN7_9CRUS|nr:unnamed protein product [Darwinula stevensoni]CAG0892715.1 unnamed protein product [Darwinula stevensoni]
MCFGKREAGTRIEEVHVVGHSLGSHLASYIGSTLKDMGWGNLGRITGLDPAEVHFEYADPRVRLDPEDALFVDVVHTDASPLAIGGKMWILILRVSAKGNIVERRGLFLMTGLGIVQPSGHVDFYPNSGARMPGCGFSLQDSIERKNGSTVYGRKYET